jgi:CheY-like chemotaxis protein
MHKGRILVVQDDPAIATVVEETLTAEAYEVVHAGAVSALRLGRELQPPPLLPIVRAEPSNEHKTRRGSR